MHSCGILGHLNNDKGAWPVVSYSLKESAKDFIVRELDLDGDPVPIKDDGSATLKVASEESLLTLQKVNVSDTAPSVEEAFSDILDKDSVEAIKEFLSQTDKSQEDQLVLEPVLDKERRTLVHTAIKRFPLLTSETCTQSGRIHVQRMAKGAKKRRMNREEMQASIPSVRFTLEKSMMDTMDAVSNLARRMRIAPRTFSYAGTKDRKAHTFQQVALRGCTLKRIVGLQRALDQEFMDLKEGKDRSDAGGDQEEGVPGRFMRIINPRLWDSGEAGLGLGDLAGNLFSLVIRNVSIDDADLECRISAISKNGFLNYFGLQRFGASPSVPSHRIGSALLRGEWREACELLLGPRALGEEFGPIVTARQTWSETHDPSVCLPLYPRWCHGERSVLQHLSTRGSRDYCGAVAQGLARELRMMYVHAVQSYIWNAQLSRLTINKKGDDAIPETLRMLGYESRVDQFTREILVKDLGIECTNANADNDLYYKLPFQRTPQTEKLWDFSEQARSTIVRPGCLEWSRLGEDATVRLTFSLPPSSYATMLLWELFGCHPNGQRTMPKE